MSHVNISSTNPNFSFILGFNPASAAVTKSIKGGTGLLSYENPQSVDLVFIDGLEDLSSATSDERALNGDTYSSPSNIRHLLKKFGTVIYKDKSADIDTSDYVHTATITQIRFPYGGAKSFQKVFSSKVKLDVDPGEFGIDTNVTLTTLPGGTLRNLWSAMYLLVSMAMDRSTLGKLKDEFFIDFNRHLIEGDMEPGFIIRACTRFINDPDGFEELSHYFNIKGVEMAYGNNLEQRMNTLSKIDGIYSNFILDIGCGEGNYLFRSFGKSIVDGTYTGVDIDEEMVEKVTAKAKARGFNVDVKQSVWEVNPETRVFNILLTEVLEHMENGIAFTFLKNILNQFKADTIAITVPNRSFNKHYGLEGLFRHSDHDWEPTYEEMQMFIDKILTAANADYDVKYSKLGTLVDGESPQTLVVIKPKVVPLQAILTRGLPGSGKSTFARKLVAQGWEEVNRDALRFGTKDHLRTDFEYSAEKERKVTKKAEAQIAKAAGEGKRIIMSDTHLSPKYLKINETLLKSLGYVVTIVDFDLPFDEIILNNTRRTGGVPTDVLQQMNVRKQRSEHGIIPFNEPEGALPGYLVDLDGTLFNIDHRSPHDVSAMKDDTLNHSVFNVVKALITSGVKVIFVSGRNPESKYIAVLKLAEAFDMDQDEILVNLYMRPEDDFRPDHVVKKELFGIIRHFNPEYKWTAIDDRLSVIENCWEVLGIPVLKFGLLHERF